ncbi:hypothetical protein C5167_050827 [Papaver somniferum]|uniref:Uncharacterized protein n=1 Tax=Papaver somniferum TaxID=3469 RepID=A0A4Y7KTB5_PAPSO|nr:hypothetical protein C5167_050827 [Papaver somniferum]
MNRQKSILSYMQKKQEDQKSTIPSNANNFPCQSQKQNQTRFEQFGMGKNNLEDDFVVVGTDTPPEKLPRKILPSNFKANHPDAAGAAGSSLFSRTKVIVVYLIVHRKLAKMMMDYLNNKHL